MIAIFDQIPAFLSKSERRIVMNKIENGSTFPKYHDTFFWLSDSMIANECFNCSDPNVGLSLNEDRTYVKCYVIHPKNFSTKDGVSYLPAYMTFCL